MLYFRSLITRGTLFFIINIIMNSTYVTELPRGGQLVALACNGKYMGCSRNISEPVKVVNQLNLNQKFIIELENNLYAFRQQISNLYVGGDIAEGTKCVLVPAKKSAEQFYLQPILNGNVRIRSIRDTYLCLAGNLLTWKTIPDNAEECLWRIIPLESEGGFGGINPHEQHFEEKKQYGFLPDGATITIKNKYGYIGKTKGVYEALEIVNAASTNQHWKVTRTNNNRVGFRQVFSGLFLGHNPSPGDRLLLAPCFEGHQKFEAENQGNNVFILKNIKSLFVGLKGSHLVLKINLDDTCFWEYEIVSNPSQFNMFPKGLTRITQVIPQ